MSSAYSSKERVLRALARQCPDRVPINYFANPGIDARLKQHFGLAAGDGEDLPNFAWAAWGEAVAILADGRQLRLSAMPVTEPEVCWRQREVVIAWGFAKECPAHAGRRRESSSGSSRKINAITKAKETIR